MFHVDVLNELLLEWNLIGESLERETGQERKYGRVTTVRQYRLSRVGKDPLNRNQCKNENMAQSIQFVNIGFADTEIALAVVCC